MPAFSRVSLDGGTRRSHDLNNYLATRTGAEMTQLVQSMQDPKAQAAFTAALLFGPSPVTVSTTVPEKAKKALNAFVGFRCYYINIPPFKEYPMKMISQPMGTLWECDPNKPKWSLMAKAWSIMRDQVGKDKVPLNVFFSYACPYLDIPPPEAYLRQLGWILGVDKNGAPTVKQDPSFTTLCADSGVADKARSVEDIIHHVQGKGYAAGFVLNSTSTSTTFLGHSNAVKSRTVIMKQTALSAQAAKKRAIERNDRQVKRQLAHRAGFSSHIYNEIEQSSANEGMQGTAYDSENSYNAQQPAYQTPKAELNFSIGNEVYQVFQQAGPDTIDQQEGTDDPVWKEMFAMAARLNGIATTASKQQPGGEDISTSDTPGGFPFLSFAGDNVEAEYQNFQPGAESNTFLEGMAQFP